MLEDINSRVRNLWNSSDERAQITFVDDGFSELLKWRGSDSNYGNSIAAVLSLNMDASDLLLVSSYMAKRLLFCVSYVSSDVFRKVKNLIKVSGATEAIILLSISPDAFRTVVDSSKVQLQFLQASDGDASTDRSYDWLHRFLKPECVGIVYYPVHSFSILSSVGTNTEQRNNAGDDAQCELINITSPTCRDVNPLTLHSVGMWNINDSIQNISDLPAGDIPLRESAKLKGFAHELAGTLLFDLGLDPSASIFALGSTSSLIGRHLQPVLSSLSKTRSSLIKTERVQSSCAGTEILLSGSIISTSASSSSSSAAAAAAAAGTPITPKMTSDNIFQPKPAAASSGGSLFPLPLPSRSLPGQSTAATGPERMSDVTSKYTAQCSLDTLQAASLLLIDRTQDLYTPSTHSGEASKELHTSPLAHRILCTLSKGLGSADSTLYDVSTMAPFNAPSSSTSTSSSGRGGGSGGGGSMGVVHGGAIDMDALGRPFPAISTLPLQLPMSLCLSLNNLQEKNLSGTHGRGLSESGIDTAAGAGAVHADSDLLLLRQALFARSEEEGRTLLCAALTRRIKQFRGTVPPSKKGRGLGAEVFALVQALSACPGVTGDTLGNWLDRKEKESHEISSLEGRGSEELNVPILKDSNSIGFSPCTCLSTQALLSVSMLVVEAMQRSSKKQFKLHAGPCASWITSGEARSAADVEVQRLINEGKNLGDLISHLKNILEADMNGSSSSSVPSSSSSSAPSPRITRSKVSSASATATSTSTPASGISGQRSSSPSGADSDPADAVCVLLQLVRAISYFGLRNDKNKEGNDRYKDREESTNGESNSGNLFSSSDFSHLRKPESVNRTVKITDFADEKGFALSALKGFLGVLEGYLMMRSPPGELHYLSRLGLISKYLVDDILSHRAQSPASRSSSQPSLYVEVEVEEEMSEEAARFRLEMSDCISHLGGLFTELGSLSSLPPPLPPSAFPSPSRPLNNAVAVVGKSVDGVGGQESLGVIARSVLSFLRHRLHQLSNQNSGRGVGNGSGSGTGVALGGFLTANLRPSPQSGTGIGIGICGNPGPECDDIISACEFIEPPLKVIKRVGMDILSTGWGRLGFQSGAGNAANGTAKDRENAYEAVLVVCVVGGVSYIEVAQVQSVLSSFLKSYPEVRTSGGAPRVVIVSTSALEPESLLKYLRPAESTR